MRAQGLRAIVGAGVMTAMVVAAYVTAGAQAQRPAGRATAGQAAAADVNKTDAEGLTPLHRAVRAGELARVQALLKGGADVNAPTRYASITPISVAAINGDPTMVETLLKAGANANATNAEGETVLMTAARTGNPQVVRLLLASGANVNAREGWFQQTALIWAAAQNHAEVVKVLAEAGADLNARSTVPAARAGRGGGGGNNNTTTAPAGGLSALLYAARNGSVESINALVDAGALLNFTDPNGISPLVYALINGHFDAAAVLLEKGADPNIVDTTGRGPLYVAADMHTLEFRFNRPDPKLTDKLTSLDLVKLLIAKGAKIDQELRGTIIPPKGFAGGNRNMTAGSTPFLKAATTSDLELMKILIAAGANPKATNRSGTNALMMVAGVGWRVIYSRGTQDEAIQAVQYLLDMGFDINAANDAGDTALHGSAMRTSDQDANKLIEFLVSKGADLYAKNKKGRTAFDESEGEEITPENGGGDRRGINVRTRAKLQELMDKNPPRQAAGQ